MGMLSCDSTFSSKISNIVKSLKETPYAEAAHMALEEALKYSEHTHIMHIFQNLKEELQSSNEERVQRISRELQDLVEKESARVKRVSQEIILRMTEPPTGEHPDVGEEEPAPQLNLLGIDQTTNAESPHKISLIESLPLDSQLEIFRKLPDLDHEALFQALLMNKSPFVIHSRQALIVDAQLSLPSADEELSELYLSTFGAPLVLASEAPSDTTLFGIALFHSKLYVTVQRLKNLPAEFEALPEETNWNLDK